MDNIYIRYLVEYYAEHGTINDISTKAVVEFEGQSLKIGNFLATIRYRHRLYLDGINKRGSLSPNSIQKYQILDEMNFEWIKGNPIEIEDLDSTDIRLKYLREYYQEHGTINDIPQNAIVDFEGKKLRIGDFIQAMRNKHHYYLRGENRTGSFSEISLKRYQALDEMNFEWTPRETAAQDAIAGTNPYLKYLKHYYEEHGTINDIEKDTVVEFEGKTLKIGNFLITFRGEYAKYKAGKQKSGTGSKRNLAIYQALDEMGFIWSPQKNKLETIEDNLYIRYLKEHYEQYGTINDISASAIVEYQGKKLKIGDFISRMRYSYKRFQKDSENSTYRTPLLLKQYAILTTMGFIWIKEPKQSLNDILKQYGLGSSHFYKYKKKFNGDIDKAIKFALLNKRSETAERKTSYNLDNILEVFDIDIDALVRLLNRDTLRTKGKKEKTIYYKGMTLREFCIQNGYNYDIIHKAIKLKKDNLCDEDFESLINRSILDYKTKGQKRPATWIYGKYGNEVLVKHMLLLLGFDSRAILQNMTHNAISLDEAFSIESFKKNSKNGFNYLEEVYQDFIKFYKKVNENPEYDSKKASDALLDYANELIKEYHLTSEEFQVITSSFKDYTNAIHQYRLFDVAFEKDNETRVKKIITYNLDDDDIEEAFFLPLKFDQKVLIGRDSQLYKRRVLLRNLTIIWNDLTDEEKTNKITSYNLTQEEQFYIKDTRQTIDTAKAKVKQTIIK